MLTYRLPRCCNKGHKGQKLVRDQKVRLHCSSCQTHNCGAGIFCNYFNADGGVVACSNGSFSLAFNTYLENYLIEVSRDLPQLMNYRRLCHLLVICASLLSFTLDIKSNNKDALLKHYTVARLMLLLSTTWEPKVDIYIMLHRSSP